MTREERLKSCSICTLRKLNLQKGLLCSLTDEFADFEVECESFVRDADEVERKFENEMAAAGDGSSGDKKDYKFNKIIGLVVIFIAVFWMIFIGIGILPILVLLYGLFSVSRGLQQEKIALKHKEEKDKFE